MRIRVTILLLLASGTMLPAKLLVKVEEPKRSGGKAVVKLTIKNGFKEAVESARASVLVLTEENKMAGQSSQWVIGGTKDKPALAPGATNTFNFVISTDKPFTKTKVTFTRIVLEGGNVVEAPTNFEIVK